MYIKLLLRSVNACSRTECIVFLLITKQFRQLWDFLVRLHQRDSVCAFLLIPLKHTNQTFQIDCNLHNLSSKMCGATETAETHQMDVSLRLQPSESLFLRVQFC